MVSNHQAVEVVSEEVVSEAVVVDAAADVVEAVQEEVDVVVPEEA